MPSSETVTIVITDLVGSTGLASRRRAGGRRRAAPGALRRAPRGSRVLVRRGGQEHRRRPHGRFPRGRRRGGLRDLDPAAHGAAQPCRRGAADDPRRRRRSATRRATTATTSACPWSRRRGSATPPPAARSWPASWCRADRRPGWPRLRARRRARAARAARAADGVRGELGVGSTGGRRGAAAGAAERPGHRRLRGSRARGRATARALGRGAGRPRARGCWYRASRASARPGFSPRPRSSCTPTAAVVLLGHCPEELKAPYGAWIQALSHYVEHAPEDLLAEHVERHGGELSRLVPALARRVPGVPPPKQTDPETERYLLFAAVGGLLDGAGSDSPVVLLLDDLHWADGPTLSLLKHVLAEARPARLLMLGTYRDSDLSGATRSRQCSRTCGARRASSGWRSAGLGEDEVVSLMEAAAGHEMDAHGHRAGPGDRGRDRRQPVLRRRDAAPSARVGGARPSRRGPLGAAPATRRARAFPRACARWWAAGSSGWARTAGRSSAARR